MTLGACWQDLCMHLVARPKLVIIVSVILEYECSELSNSLSMLRGLCFWGIRRRKPNHLYHAHLS